MVFIWTPMYLFNINHPLGLIFLALESGYTKSQELLFLCPETLLVAILVCMLHKNEGQNSLSSQAEIYLSLQHFDSRIGRVLDFSQQITTLLQQC